jgi:hypothetical protein
MGAVETEVTPNAAVSYLPTCNLLVRRDVVLAQGGFDAALRVGEDVDFIWRTLRSGHRAWYVPRAESCMTIACVGRLAAAPRRLRLLRSGFATTLSRRSAADAPAANQPVVAAERGADAVVRTIGGWAGSGRLDSVRRGTGRETARATADRSHAAGRSSRRRAGQGTCSGFISPERQCVRYYSLPLLAIGAIQPHWLTCNYPAARSRRWRITGGCNPNSHGRFLSACMAWNWPRINGTLARLLATAHLAPLLPRLIWRR